jgi:hypothetical protein
MGCYREDYRAHVGTWAARTSRGTAQGHGSSGHAIRQLGNMYLCAAALAVLLAIGGVKQNPGPGVEANNIVQVLCSVCSKNLKSGIQCDTLGRWFHNSYRNVKNQTTDNRKGNKLRISSGKTRGWKISYERR